MVGPDRQAHGLSRAALRRPAAARRDRPLAGAVAAGHAVRRGDLGARSRAHGRGAGGDGGPRRRGMTMITRHARDGLRAPRRRPRGVHAPGQGVGERPDRRAVRQPEDRRVQPVRRQRALAGRSVILIWTARIRALMIMSALEARGPMTDQPPPSPATAITVSFSGSSSFTTSMLRLSGQTKSASSGAIRPMKRSSWYLPQ